MNMSTEPRPESTTPENEPRNDQPVPASEVDKLLFPHGGITKSTLQTVARNNRLQFTRIRDFGPRQVIRSFYVEPGRRLTSLSLDQIIKELRKPKK